MQHSLILKEPLVFKSLFLNYRIPFIFFSTFLVLSFSVYAESIAIFPCFILFGFLGITISALQGSNGVKIYTTVYSISSIFAIFFFILFKLEYGAPYQGGGSDGLAYENHASEIKNLLFHYNAEEIGNIIDQPYHNSKGYIYFISLLMRFSDLFGGFHTMIARLFNVNLLALCSVLVYAIAKRISLNKKQSTDCAIITGLFPIMIYTSVQSYRDIPILFILLLSVLLALIFLESKFILKQLIIIFCFCLLILVVIEIRLLNTINIVAMLCATLYIKFFSLKRVSNLHILFATLTLAVLILIIFSSDLAIFVELINKLDSSSTDLSEGNDRSQDGGLSLILFNLPIPIKFFASIAYSLITPLPIFYIKDFDWNFLSLGTIYQFLFIPFVLLGVKSTFRSREMLPLLLMFILTYVGYVFGSFTFRHIIYIVPFAAIYGSIGYEKYKHLRKFMWFSTGWLLVFLILTYYAIKIIY